MDGCGGAIHAGPACGDGVVDQRQRILDDHTINTHQLCGVSVSVSVLVSPMLAEFRAAWYQLLASRRGGDSDLCFFFRPLSLFSSLSPAAPVFPCPGAPIF